MAQEVRPHEGTQCPREILHADLRHADSAMAIVDDLATVRKGFIGAQMGRAGRCIAMLASVFRASPLGIIFVALKTTSPRPAVDSLALSLSRYLVAAPLSWGSIAALLGPVAAAATVALINLVCRTAFGLLLR